MHEYAGGKGLHHPTTEARGHCRRAAVFRQLWVLTLLQVSPGDRRVTLAKVSSLCCKIACFNVSGLVLQLTYHQPMRTHDQPPAAGSSVSTALALAAAAAADGEAPELFMGAQCIRCY